MKSIEQLKAQFEIPFQQLTNAKTASAIICAHNSILSEMTTWKYKLENESKVLLALKILSESLTGYLTDKTNNVPDNELLIYITAIKHQIFVIGELTD